MTRTQRLIAAVAALVASNASAQTRMEVFICEGREGVFYISASVLDPEYDVLAVLADFQFRLTGQDIAYFQYNDAFDSDIFGPASVMVTEDSIKFSGGNNLPPLNDEDGPDSRNPLYLGTVVAESLDSFELLGQNAGAYQIQPGEPFPRILMYQIATGQPGDTPFSIELWWNCHTSLCRGDMNGDFVLTPADLTAWINAYNNGAWLCDQNYDGLCTPSDFTAWLAHYNAGCW